MPKKLEPSRPEALSLESTPTGGVVGAGVEEFEIGAKIRTLRLARGLTLQDVARETGFSPALISQVEHNNVSPPIATLAKIARALRVKVASFFEEGDVRRRFEVVRADQRRKVDRVMSRLGSRHGYAYDALAFSVRNRKMSPFLLTIAKESEAPEALYTHEGEEFLLVLSGRAELQIEEDRFELDAGDSVYLDAGLRHCLARLGEEEAKVLAILCH
jgi:transcriptional regulator with XRE-family HTH domain